MTVDRRDGRKEWAAYLRVLFGIVFVAAAIATLMPFLHAEQTVLLFAAVLGVEFLIDVAATIYVASLYLDRRRTWLMLMIVTTCAMTTIGLAPIAILVVLRVLGQPPLPGGLGQIITGMGLVIAGAVPVMKAVLFRMVRDDPEERRA